MSIRSGKIASARLCRALVLLALIVGLPAPAAAQLTAGGAAPVTVVVDPARCSQAARVAHVRVVCSLSAVPGQVRSGSTVVLRPGRHRGPLDLRDVAQVTVRGEPGAVVEAGSGSFALSLRNVQDVTISGLTLRGGSNQSVWVERTARVTLDRLVVEGSAGAGVQVRDSQDLRLARSRITGAASAGVMELTGVVRSVYEGLAVSGNGRGAAEYNGDGMQLSGADVVVRDVIVTGNGSSARFEHGIYVSPRARGVRLTAVTSRDNAGVAVKLGGSGRLDRSVLHDDGTALYCGRTAGPGWQVRSTTSVGATPTHREAGCRWTVDD